MASFFRQLGRAAGSKLRKARWLLHALTGSEAEALDAEYQVGRDLTAAIAREMGQYPDAALAKRVEHIGGHLTTCITNRQRRFQFHLLNTNEVNALALPGGFIWISPPLIQLCGETPDALAFVLGHEMGHVVRKHALNRLLAGSVLNTVVRLAPIGGLVGSQLKNVLQSLVQQRYSQDQEFEADEFGLKLVRAGGFDPSAAAKLFQRLEERGGEPAGLELFFSTHPPFRERIARLNQLPQIRSL